MPLLQQDTQLLISDDAPSFNADKEGLALCPPPCSTPEVKNPFVEPPSLADDRKDAHNFSFSLCDVSVEPMVSVTVNYC